MQNSQSAQVIDRSDDLIKMNEGQFKSHLGEMAGTMPRKDLCERVICTARDRRGQTCGYVGDRHSLAFVM